MNDVVIRVENLGKRYHIGKAQERHDTLRDALVAGLRAPVDRLRRNTNHGSSGVDGSDTIWALKGVSFEVKRGEVVGVIGRNGAGKSTLLKILSRITEPTEGRAEIDGRVGSLLEVGTGFHVELTGRENIYLNGAILGMKRAEIDRKFDEIVAFAEIDQFLDTPVKRYSSGMYVRLAFAVAAHLEPEILLVDEVLAVGDFGFQEKCLGKMNSIALSGHTVLFVSHNLGAIVSLCNRCIQVRRGQLVNDGKSEDVVRGYLAKEVSTGEIDLRDWSLDRMGTGPMQVVHVGILDRSMAVCSSLVHGEPFAFDVAVSGRKGTDCIVSISVRDASGNIILHLNNTDDQARVTLAGELTRIRVFVPTNILNDGKYYVTVWLGDSLNTLHDRVGNCLMFSVDSSTLGSIRSQGLVRIPADWTTAPIV